MKEQTIQAGIVATSAMTAFSYALSAMKGNNFREPELLNKLMHNQTCNKQNEKDIDGWLLHYTLGLAWAGLYDVWNKQAHRSSLYKAALFSCFSGATGVLSWKLLFEWRRVKAPRSFYTQLFCAHILYTFIVSRIIR